MRTTAIKSLPLVLSLLAIACTGNVAGPVAGDPTGKDAWQQLRAEGNEVEGYLTIDEMSGAADAVIAARIRSIERGRVFQGDAAGDRVYYALVLLEVDQELRGRADGREIPLELLLPQVFDDDGFAKAIGQISGSLSGDRVVVFLRRKSDSDKAVYRPVSSVGMFASTHRAILDTPLSESPPAVSGPYHDELADVRTLDDLIALLIAKP